MNAASNVIQKLGGPSAASRKIGKHISRVFAWKQTGIIPARVQRRILEIASAEGIDLSPADFFEVGHE